MRKNSLHSPMVKMVSVLKLSLSESVLNFCYRQGGKPISRIDYNCFGSLPFAMPDSVCPRRSLFQATTTRTIYFHFQMAINANETQCSLSAGCRQANGSLCWWFTTITTALRRKHLTATMIFFSSSAF